VHLCRLLHKLPSLLANASPPLVDAQRRIVEDRCAHLVRFLTKNKGRYLSPDYTDIDV
jgi:hypothetical protein